MADQEHHHLKTLEESILAPFFESSGMVDLVGRDSHVKGEMRTGRLARIDGRIEGNIRGQSDESSTVIVARTGEVEGTVTAANIVINGYVKGNVKAFNRIRVGHNGRIVGSIEAPAVIIERGAFIFGQSLMTIPEDNPLAGLTLGEGLSV